MSTADSFVDPVLRVTGIKDSEEVMIWEVRQKRAKERQVSTMVYNRVDRSCLRWPFYAYASNDHEIIVTNMATS